MTFQCIFVKKMNRPGKRELVLLLKCHTYRTQGVSNQSCFLILCACRLRKDVNSDVKFCHDYKQHVVLRVVMSCTLVTLAA
jgi:hypothetical protein